VSELRCTSDCPHCDEYHVSEFTPLQELFIRYESYCKETPDRDVSNIVDYICKFENADTFETQFRALLFTAHKPPRPVHTGSGLAASDTREDSEGMSEQIRVIVAGDHKEFIGICRSLGLNWRQIKYVNFKDVDNGLAGYYRENIYPDNYAIDRPSRQK
jgi:hypothetical protein